MFRYALMGILCLGLAFSASAQADPDSLQPFKPDDATPSVIQLESLNGALPAAAASAVPPRKILNVSIGLIKTFEGWDPNVYDDPAGYCTIGFGHLIAKTKCETLADYGLGKFEPELTLDLGNELLIRDTIPARRLIQNLVTVNLTHRQFGALTAFAYNVGGKNFGKSTLLKLLNNQDYEGAAKEFPRWVRANGVVLKGLVRRRYCEQNLFRGYGHLESNGLLDVSQCSVAAGLAPTNVETVDIDLGEDR